MIATPVFHRWHHTSPDEGGNTNFAGTFPLWDILFGTFRLPEGRLPDNYGIDDQSSFPTEIAGQLAYPFRQIAFRMRSAVGAIATSYLNLALTYV